MEFTTEQYGQGSLKRNKESGVVVVTGTSIQESGILNVVDYGRIQKDVVSCMMINAGAIASGVLYFLFVHTLTQNGSGGISLGYEVYLFLIGASVTRECEWGYRKAKGNMVFIGEFGAVVALMVFTGFAFYRNDFYATMIPFGIICSALSILNISIVVKYRRIDFKNLGKEIKKGKIDVGEGYFYLGLIEYVNLNFDDVHVCKVRM